MSPLNPPLVAVVEIGSTAGVLAFAVFVITFVIVCAVFWLFRQGKAGPRGATTWRVDATRQLPVEKPTFDALASLTEEALASRPVTPAAREAAQSLGRVRDTVARLYRITMTLVGVCGIAFSIVLFRQADSGNMLGLPAGIVLLLSLGALGSGLIPSRTVDPVAPIDPELFKNIHVHASTQPMEIRLDRVDLIRASEMLRAGASPADVARAIHPDYDTLQEFEKTAVQHAIAAAARHH
jgi:hypothetical protein